MSASQEIQALRQQANSLFEQTRDGEIPKGTAAVLIQITQLQIRLAEAQSKVEKADKLALLADAHADAHADAELPPT